MANTSGFLDRRVRTGCPGLTAVYDGTGTTWTLPYAVAVDGSEGTMGVFIESTGALAVSTRPSETQIRVAGSDLTTTAVSIGVLYQFTYVPSPIYLRDAKGNTDLTTKLMIHHLTAKYAETLSIGSLVTRKTRTTQSQQLKTFTTPKAGDFNIPIHADRDDILVLIRDGSASSCVLTGLTWTGTVRSPDGRKV